MLRLALPLALPLALLALSTGATDEEAARSLLEKAEERAAEGRYGDALKLYQELARAHPDTAPGTIGARRSLPNALLGWTPLEGGERLPNRVDVVLAGDGYTFKHLASFENQADDVPPIFERNEVLGEYASYFQFVRAAVVSAEDGVDEFERDYSTAFGAFDSGKTGNDVDLDRARAAALLTDVPGYRGLAIVIVRAGRRGTGTAGVAAVAERDPIALVRAFGGAFAGLGDELETDQGIHIEAHPAPNISSTEDPTQVPWKHFLEARIPGVGVYPGGLGRVDGVYKPVADGCAMEDTGIFCPVCREAVILAIHRYVDPIESASPPPSARDAAASEDLGGARKLDLEVTVMQPKRHALEVRWWVLPESEAPLEPKPPGETFADRRARGPLPDLDAEPSAETKPDRKGLARFKLDTGRLEPGRYRVVCRVRDSTDVRGEKTRWVLTDPHGLLESERAWWVTVQ